MLPKGRLRLVKTPTKEVIRPITTVLSRPGPMGPRGESVTGPQGPSGEPGQMPEHRWVGNSIQFKNPTG